MLAWLASWFTKPQPDEELHKLFEPREPKVETEKDVSARLAKKQLLLKYVKLP